MSLLKNSTHIALAAAAALLFATACGDDGGGETADAAANTDGGGGSAADASTSPDATPTPDAMPAPDADPSAYACLGQPLPTTAIDPLAVSGSVYTIGLGGQSPIAGANIQAFATGTTTSPLASTTSAASGAYSMNTVTGGNPLNAYVKAVATSYLDTYLIPPWPLTAGFDNASVIMLSGSTLGLLAQLTGATQSMSNGFVALVVLDCNNDPVAGATVTVTGTHGAIKYMSSNFPSGSATATDVDGIAFIFDVAPGTVTVDASVNGMSLREHSVNVIANTLTATVVTP